MKKVLLLIILAGFATSLLAQKPTRDMVAAKKVVINFFNWYRSNSKKINSFKLYKSKTKNGGPPYIIDWKQAERYFTYIRKYVPFMGETFIQNERKYFKQAQLDFNKYPEDEIPSGFDYDRFTGGQEEPKYVIDQQLLGENTKIEVEVIGTKANVIFKSYFTTDEDKQIVYTSKIEMAKEKGQWKIARNILSVE